MGCMSCPVCELERRQREAAESSFRKTNFALMRAENQLAEERRRNEELKSLIRTYEEIAR
jgi:hypothetical protein